MASAYEYLIVYLPQYNPASFLLFVHNVAGSTKLRDYSGGRERVLGQPSLKEISQATESGKTRFSDDPTGHAVSEALFWESHISEYNRRYLTSAQSGPSLQTANPSRVKRTSRVAAGRAERGSRRQLQDYVNDQRHDLNNALLNALPAKVRESSPEIKWVSPLASDDYAEYRDADFLELLGLGESSRRLAEFWPLLGPCWDALATVRTALPGTLPIAVLVEAKSHIAEVYGSGCEAGSGSRPLIEKSLGLVKKWCNATPESDWTGPLYQSANRIAHLYFFREVLRRPVCLVNIYFLNDPYRPTTETSWKHEVQTVKSALGLRGSVPGLVELYLSALDIGSANNAPTLGFRQEVPQNKRSTEDEVGADDHLPGTRVSFCLPNEPELQVSSTDASFLPGSATFGSWREKWSTLAAYPGAQVPDADQRIEQLLRLWKDPIPGNWKRGIDTQLLEVRYRRRDHGQPHNGEHKIEHEILSKCFDRVVCFGEKLVDGISAFPLCRDTEGYRRGNVEADMLLLAESGGHFHQYLCEVKDQSNDAWYATVESLRQLRLYLAADAQRCIFTHRGLLQSLPANIPVSALVLAPKHFYEAPGKKQNALKPTARLIARFITEFGTDIRLAVWDAVSCQIVKVDL